MSLDDYECYARWSSGGHRHPAFSLRLDPPAPVDAARITAIAAQSAAQFGRAREEVAHEVDRVLAARGMKLGMPLSPELRGVIGADHGRLQLTGAQDPPVRRRNERRDRREGS